MTRLASSPLMVFVAAMALAGMPFLALTVEGASSPSSAPAGVGPAVNKALYDLGKKQAASWRACVFRVDVPGLNTSDSSAVNAVANPMVLAALDLAGYNGVVTTMVAEGQLLGLAVYHNVTSANANREAHKFCGRVARMPLPTSLKEASLSAVAVKPGMYDPDMVFSAGFFDWLCGGFWSCVGKGLCRMSCYWKSKGSLQQKVCTACGFVTVVQQIFG